MPLPSVFIKLTLLIRPPEEVARLETLKKLGKLGKHPIKNPYQGETPQQKHPQQKPYRVAERVYLFVGFTIKV